MTNTITAPQSLQPNGGTNQAGAADQSNAADSSTANTAALQQQLATTIYSVLNGLVINEINNQQA